MNKEQLLVAIDNCKNKSDIYVIFGYSKNPNSRSISKVKQQIKDITGKDLDSLFSSRFYTTKVCPVCNKEYIRYTRDIGTTCSNACANSYFRSGLNNPNANFDNYRTICFHYHKKQCVVCAEANIVEVHHLDENNINNAPSNLIPLCPTHHKYWHSGFKYLVEPKILEYIITWKNNRV